jgi:FtsH-binding integral membrane protein
MQLLLILNSSFLEEYNDILSGSIFILAILAWVVYLIKKKPFSYIAVGYLYVVLHALAFILGFISLISTRIDVFDSIYALIAFFALVFVGLSLVGVRYSKTHTADERVGGTNIHTY